MFFQLLLFVDERPSSLNNIRQITAHLENLKPNIDFKLDVIEINRQPHLVEHFKLVATPALVKITPAPRQTLTGSNLVEQLKQWLPKWMSLKRAVTEEDRLKLEQTNTDFFNCSIEVIELSDEIFRLKQEKEELASQLRFKDQIIAMLAHDLRSPLTAASIAVETIELADRQQQSDKSIKLKSQLFKQAKQQFKIANSMIADLLQSSRDLNGKLKVKPSQFDIRLLCEEANTQLQKRFRQKSQVFKLDIPQDLPLVHGDRELIRQLIINLLDNAIKYTPEAGEVSLSVLHRTSQKIQVSICDTGAGIPAEKQETIFEGSFRLKRDENEEGYGLGLAWCRQIVRAHYGQIWVDSSCDRGSSFHFMLPVYK
ncbi:histidine kinase [Myxosarcina sp. GI1]|uniref:histidine kinase n=1 Tax=Myxosarcina sp. GI1 TaxID=1541065 RepID=UPI000A9497FD|nr:histidine kinase [Myxosarcina sp. GI1]